MSVGGRIGVVAGADPGRLGEDVVVVEEAEVVDGDEPDVVPPPVRRPGQVDPGEGRLLRPHVGDDEANPHFAIP